MEGRRTGGRGVDHALKEHLAGMPLNEAAGDRSQARIDDGLEVLGTQSKSVDLRDGSGRLHMWPGRAQDLEDGRLADHVPSSFDAQIIDVAEHHEAVGDEE